MMEEKLRVFKLEGVYNGRGAKGIQNGRGEVAAYIIEAKVFM